MFRIPTYLAPSPVHGTGVFAAEPIARGERIWQFDPDVDWLLEPGELDAFPQPWQDRLRSFCYVDDAGRHVLCGDNARFMNHADQPNCDDSGKVFTIALRDIEAGEELTCDYRTFDAESAAKLGPLYETAHGPHGDGQA